MSNRLISKQRSRTAAASPDLLAAEVLGVTAHEVAAGRSAPAASGARRVRPPAKPLLKFGEPTGSKETRSVSGCCSLQQGAKPSLTFVEPSPRKETSIVSGSALAECVCESKSLAGGYLFELTEGQRSALSFAAMCEAENLQAGKEAHEPEVQEAIAHLWEARRILEAGRPL